MDDENYKITYSPLCRRIRRNRTVIRVEIYRGEDESGWTLEVEDESGGSTVWTETFLTDQAALDEVMAVIAKEGIEAFGPEPKPTLH